MDGCRGISNWISFVGRVCHGTHLSQHCSAENCTNPNSRHYVSLAFKNSQCVSKLQTWYANCEHACMHDLVINLKLIYDNLLNCTSDMQIGCWYMNYNSLFFRKTYTYRTIVRKQGRAEEKRTVAVLDDCLRCANKEHSNVVRRIHNSHTHRDGCTLFRGVWEMRALGNSQVPNCVHTLEPELEIS